MKFETLELPADLIAETTKYEKSFGTEWGKRQIFWCKAEMWTKTVLQKVSETSKRPYNCYVEGVNVWKRVDGQPITQDDLDALKHYTLGQGNKIVGKVGDMTVSQEWCCDSSD